MLNKTLNINLSSSGLNPRFWLVMKCPFPEHQEGLAEWKVKRGDCVQDKWRRSLLPGMKSSGMEWEGAEGIN